MHYMNQANAHNATQDTTMQDSATHDTATKATQDTAPLKGITVIDWTQVQSGPSCTHGWAPTSSRWRRCRAEIRHVMK